MSKSASDQAGIHTQVASARAKMLNQHFVLTLGHLTRRKLENVDLWQWKWGKWRKGDQQRPQRNTLESVMLRKAKDESFKEGAAHLVKQCREISNACVWGARSRRAAFCEVVGKVARL